MSNWSRNPGKVAPNPRRPVHNSLSIAQNSPREPCLNSILGLKLISYCNCNFVSSHPRKPSNDLYISCDKNQQEKYDKEN